MIYPTVTYARSCNKVDHLFWFTILAQHETNDVILYNHSVHKHWGNTFQRQNYKMRLKQRSLNWIDSMQVKKILFTNVFFSWSLCLLNMFPSMVFPKHLYFFRFVDIIVITVHDRFWNVGQANCILKYFENMMIDHSGIPPFSRKWPILPGKNSISHKIADYFAFPLLL